MSHEPAPLLCLMRANVLLYCKFIALPHVVVDQFVCIAQEDYCRILNHVEKNTHKVEEEGEIVMVKEHRELDRSGTRKGHVVIKVRRTPFICSVTEPLPHWLMSQMARWLMVNINQQTDGYCVFTQKYNRCCCHKLQR